MHLSQEKDKYNQMVLKFQREMTELQAALYEEGQNRTRLQMELDAKDSENEQLQARMALQNSDTASVNSSGHEMEEDGVLGIKNIYYDTKKNIMSCEIMNLMVNSFTHPLHLLQSFISEMFIIRLN